MLLQTSCRISESRGPAGRNIPLFRRPPKLFPSVFFPLTKFWNVNEPQLVQRVGRGTGGPDLHVNSFPEWLQRVPLFVFKGIDNAAKQRDRDRTDLCFSSRARYLPTIPAATVLFLD
ncbi:hypothetical protein CEXT_536371 [Caerostris extrusa]|uniref:Uncharacterized protein n=1 Tax=Caerostris extrusa TaxID=172846 RepID=A0AAV4PP91_CAEEX|nr:hypothetical protein CEXT_536371 [Caerostris extrusa]